MAATPAAEAGQKVQHGPRPPGQIVVRAANGGGTRRRRHTEGRTAMANREDVRQPGVTYVAIVLFALLVAAMLIPGYTFAF